MLGTVSLLALAILGFMQFSFWVIVPFALLNTFIGMHTPPERLERLREMGESYPKIFITTLPLQAIFAVVVFGIGYAIGALFS